MKNILTKTFQKHFDNCQNVIISQAPGRVNLIGEHTDYNNGFVLPTTIDKAIYLAIRKRSDRICHLHSLNFAAQTTFSLDEIKKDSTCHWADYIKGVIHILQNAGYNFTGIEGIVYGDIPIGAGLSSSAALEIATLNALQHLFNLSLPPLDVIKLAQKAENQFVGMQCGIMDQFVSYLGKKNHALFIDCLTLAYENIPLNFAEHSLLIVDSKVKHELVKSAYNERRTQCEEGVKYFATLDRKITSLRDVSHQMFMQHQANLPPLIRQRCYHVVSENERVLQAKIYLRENNFEQLGQLFYASHASLKNDYAVSCPEIDLIVATAQQSGALGARITGGGFGVCAIVLARKKLASIITKNICEKYQRTFNLEPTVLTLATNLETEINEFNK